jgi:hypothetical protein
MAKVTFSRRDIEDLAQRLLDCGQSSMMDDMPSVQRNMRAAAALLKYFTNVGVPVSPVEIDIFNGTI